MDYKCQHSFEEATDHLRICILCGETQKKTLKTFQPQEQEWVWLHCPFEVWKNELLEILQPININKEALAWWSALKENS